MNQITEKTLKAVEASLYLEYGIKKGPKIWGQIYPTIKKRLEKDQ